MDNQPAYSQLRALSYELLGYTDTRRLRQIFTAQELNTLISERNKPLRKSNSNILDLEYRRLLST